MYPDTTTPAYTDQFRNWGDTVMLSATNALADFMQAIPRIIGFLLILLIGWFIASAIAAAVSALLRRVRFNELARRSGFSDFVHKMGVDTDASGFLANVVKWFIRLIVLVVAFDLLGLPAVSSILRDLLLWLPNLIVALVVLVIGGLAAKALGNLVRGFAAKAGFSNPGMLDSIATGAVWVFAIIVAVNQLGIATTLVNTLFMGLVGATALAAGIAFGLGGRETAGRIVEGWYRAGQDAAPRLKKAAEETARERQHEA